MVKSVNFPYIYIYVFTIWMSLYKYFILYINIVKLPSVFVKITKAMEKLTVKDIK